MKVYLILILLSVCTCEDTANATVTSNSVITEWKFFQPETGDGSIYGYIAVKYKGEWGVITDLSRSRFQDNDAEVFCKTKGYVGGVYDGGIYKSTGGLVDGKNITSLRATIYDVTCAVNGTSLDNCTIDEWPKGNVRELDKDVGIKCYTKPVSDTIELRFFQPTITKYSFHGYIAIKYHAEWGTICQYGSPGLFDNNAANAVCTMAGYESGVYDGGIYSTGDGQINGKNRTSLRNWLYWIGCNKGETFDQCDKTKWGTNSCDDRLHVGVKCFNTSSPPPNDVQVGFFNPVKFDDFVFGYIALKFNGVWGTVCNTLFDDKDAKVICKEAGYHGGVYGNGIYDVGDGLIDGKDRSAYRVWISQVQCSGNERSFDDCSHTEWGHALCKHDADVSLKCFNTTAPITTKLEFFEPQKTDDHIFGYVAVKHSGVWGTICKDKFDDNAATVLCREAGYKGGFYASNGDYNTGGGQIDGKNRLTMRILLDDVHCHGNESSIDDCSHSLWGVHNCQHEDDVGVKCYNTSDAKTMEWKFFQPQKDDSLNDEYIYGYIAVKYQAEWGTINGDNFDDNDASVFCKSKGYFGGAFDGGFYKSRGGLIDGKDRTSLRIWFDRVNCIENGTSLDNCTFSVWPRSSTQDHYKDVGIKCYTKPGDHSKVQLGFFNPTKTAYSIHGYIAIKYHAEWGTICRYGSPELFDNHAANVLCKMGGYESGVYDGGIYNTGDGQINGINRTSLTTWLRWLSCNKGDKSIEECSHPKWAGSVCDDDKDIGLKCYNTSSPPPNNIQLKFFTREENHEYIYGYIALKYNSVWGTVCKTLFDDKDANVICKEAGYHGGVYADGIYNEGEGLMDGKNRTEHRIMLAEVQCTGSETSIDDCPHREWGTHICNHNEDVGIKCYKTPNITSSEMFLLKAKPTGGSLQGHVAIKYHAEWGRICQKGFDEKEADVLCRMNNYLGGYYDKGIYGGKIRTSLRIWTDNINCHGNETSIYDCPNGGWGKTDCQFYDDVGIKCYAATPKPTAQVRFFDATAVESYAYGLITINHHDEWGTVCQQHITDNDADVLCKMMPYGFVGGHYDNNIYNTGDGSMDGYDRTLMRTWLNKIGCVGNESTIDHCSHSEWGLNPCGHELDIGIKCYRPPKPDNKVKIRFYQPRMKDGYIDGRIAIKYHGEWGTICYEKFDDNDANVLCKEAGFGEGTYDNGTYDRGDGVIDKKNRLQLRIWLSDIECVGNETSIHDCAGISWGKTSSCNHKNDIGIKCSGNTCDKWGMTCGEFGKCTVLTETTHSCSCNDDYLEENGRCVKDEKLALKIALPIVLIILLIVFIGLAVFKCRSKGESTTNYSQPTNFENKAYVAS